MDLKKTEEEEEDHGLALQNHLDSITLSSIPFVKHSHVMELKAENSIKEGIGLLYEKSLSGALIADTANGRFLDRYIGYIGFSDMVFWSLEEYDRDKGSGECEYNIDVFSILDHRPDIAQTKIADLAKSFLWRPFFPAYLDDTLFHIMLLLSKHRLDVVSVIDRSTSRAIGFVTQTEVMKMLLQSSGLEWFDRIADASLSDLRIENEERLARVYREQSINEVVRALGRSKLGVVAVVDRESEKAIGSLRNCDISVVLKSEIVRRDTKVTIEEFLESEKNVSREMERPVTNKKTDTLKQVMENMVERDCSFSFLVDESERVVGLIGFGDVMVHFAPPCMDSSIRGDGFFEAALEQTGCRIEKGGNVVYNP